LLALLAWASPTPVRARFALRVPTLRAGTWALIAGAGLAVGIGAGALVTLLHGDAIESTQAVQKAVGEATTLQSALVIGFLTVSAPITEELLFRGFVLTRLVERWGARVAIVVSALAFGAVHLEPWQAVFAALLGGYFGWLAVRTRSVLPCIVGHLANNAWFALVALAPRAPPASAMAEAPFEPAVMITAAFVGWGVFVALLAVLKDALDHDLARDRTAPVTAAAASPSS
jgi:membrane protease YdiL (CAAX protease family)